MVATKLKPRLCLACLLWTLTAIDWLVPAVSALHLLHPTTGAHEPYCLNQNGLEFIVVAHTVIRDRPQLDSAPQCLSHLSDDEPHELGVLRDKVCHTTLVAEQVSFIIKICLDFPLRLSLVADLLP